jgi:transcriptional regulator with XRE-family HTH domain
VTTTALATRLGQRVRALRKDRGWSQEQLARRAHMGRGQLAHLEAGDNCPALPSIVCIAIALGVQPSDILRVVDDVLEDAYAADRLGLLERAS